MATVNVLLDTNWTQISTGPQDGVYVQPETKKCEIWVDATTPASTVDGITINPVSGATVRMETGENLFARAVRNTVTITVTE